ncbi:tubby C-terminal-like domain-containing protein [Dioszegia hungarica]|uniref:Tubby C-terminal-like domain-containing protein n=1 Tax=Dioszegia hungarica TaxID=4972 RepID=A0AA38H9K7_9TREE|nr:tubby C-terminal-like domain-containing protein [Dioszegia hungarica]KAI9635389.1 tubby C-terminal-like domain-containing protein [Dioszegia hungarica]
MQRLSPQDPNIAVWPQFCVGGPLTLTVQRQAFSLTGGDFQVCDQNGVAVVICQGQAMSIRGRKVVTDSQGKELCHIRSPAFSLLRTFIVEDPAGREIVQIVKRVGFGTSMKATFMNTTTSQPTSIYLHGEILGGSAILSLGKAGPPIAQLVSDFASARHIFTNAQTYAVNIAPGVDIALIAVLCITMDVTRRARRS